MAAVSKALACGTFACTEKSPKGDLWARFSQGVSGQRAAGLGAVGMPARGPAHQEQLVDLPLRLARLLEIVGG